LFRFVFPFDGSCLASLHERRQRPFPRRVQLCCIRRGSVGVDHAKYRGQATFIGIRQRVFVL
jgi:hypothetical protein